MGSWAHTNNGRRRAVQAHSSTPILLRWFPFSKSSKYISAHKYSPLCTAALNPFNWAILPEKIELCWSIRAEFSWCCDLFELSVGQSQRASYASKTTDCIKIQWLTHIVSFQQTFLLTAVNCVCSNEYFLLKEFGWTSLSSVDLFELRWWWSVRAQCEHSTDFSPMCLQ